MTGRIVVDVSDGLEPQSPVEARCLKAVRREHHLCGAAFARFALSRGHETATESMATPPFMHPEDSHLATMSPRPSVNPSDDVLVGVSQNDCEQSRIVDSRSRRVELVDAVVEKLDVARVRRVDQWKRIGKW